VGAAGIGIAAGLITVATGFIRRLGRSRLETDSVSDPIHPKRRKTKKIHEIRAAIATLVLSRDG